METGLVSARREGSEGFLRFVFQRWRKMFEDCLGGDGALCHAVAGSLFVRLMRPKCG
jgi:hypothetical protein